MARVVDEATRIPISGAQVSLHGVSVPGGGVPQVTDSTGIARLAICSRDPRRPVSSGVLLVRASGYLEKETVVEPGSLASGAMSTVLLRGAGEIAGRVVDSVSGEPLYGASVLLTPDVSPVPPDLCRQYTTTETGEFTFRGLGPRSEFALQASAVGYQPARKGPVSVEGVREEAVSLALERSRGVLVSIPNAKEPELCGSLHVVTEHLGARSAPTPTRWSDSLGHAICTPPVESSEGHVRASLVGQLGETLGTGMWSSADPGPCEIDCPVTPYWIRLVLDDAGDPGRPLPEWMQWKSGEQSGVMLVPQDLRLRAFVPMVGTGRSVDLRLGDYVAVGVRIPGDEQAIFVRRKPGTLVLGDPPSRSVTASVWALRAASEMEFAGDYEVVQGSDTRVELAPGRYRIGLDRTPLNTTITVESERRSVVSLGELLSQGTLEVRLVPPVGFAAEGPAEIRLMRAAHDRVETRAQLQASAGGTALFEGLAGGQYLAVARFGAVGESRESAVVVPSQRTIVVLTKWERPVVKRLRLLDATGRPCPGMTVGLVRLPAGSGESMDSTTDAEGRFACRIGSSGRYLVRLDANAVITDLVADDQECVLALPEPGGLRLVLDGWWKERCHRVIMWEQFGGVYYLRGDRIGENEFQLPRPRTGSSALLLSGREGQSLFLTGEIAQGVRLVTLDSPPKESTLRLSVMDEGENSSQLPPSEIRLVVLAVGGIPIGDLKAAGSMLGSGFMDGSEVTVRGRGRITLRAVGSGLDGTVRWASEGTVVDFGVPRVEVVLRPLRGR
jgi:hypothetical protein